MNTIVVIAVIVVALVTVAALAAVRVKSTGETQLWPFYVKKPLSQPEQVLYFRLVKALPNHIVLAQVQLSRFLGVKKGHKFNEWNNRINRMSVDFLVCNRDATVVAVIELDDKTHASEDRKLADAKKERALDAAEVTLVRWNVNAIPEEATIRAVIVPPDSPLTVVAKLHK